MRRIIVLYLAICLVFGLYATPVGAKVRKAPGTYESGVFGPKCMKREIKTDLGESDIYENGTKAEIKRYEKKQKARNKKKLALYKRNKKKYFKKYCKSYIKNKKIATCISTKLKGNRYTTWGNWIRKYNGKKKKYKYNKHTFILSKYCKFYSFEPNNYGGYDRVTMKRKSGRKLLREPNGLGVEMTVIGGKVYTIYFKS